MLFKEAESLGDIYRKHYYANMTDKDIENTLAGENIGYGALGSMLYGGLGTGLGAALYARPATGLLLGSATGGLVGYGAGKLSENMRRQQKQKTREQMQAALNKKAADNSDDLYKRYYDAAMLANTASINKNTEYANTLNSAKGVAAYKGINNLDPRDSADYLELENYFDSPDSKLVDQHVNGPKNTKQLLGFTGGALIGVNAPNVVREFTGKPIKMHVPKMFLGGVAGGIAGSQLAKLIKRKDYEYTPEEAMDRVQRTRQAYKAALKEKYNV